MSVWSLSGSGRLNEQTMPLAEVDLTINSDVNTWPRSLGAAELADNLRALSVTPILIHYFPTALCASKQADGRMAICNVTVRQKIVPYTEARQCANYKVKA